MTSYAFQASPEFNRQLDGVLAEIAAETARTLGDGLVALILGGGYGRGEGGIFLRDGREEPYNDLDLTLVVTDRNLPALRRLAPIEECYAARLGIHVDFSRPLTVEDIVHWPHWLMWQDLLNGHVVLHGPQDILTAHAPASLLAPLPPVEALRLLLNRGAGLLWARRVLLECEPEPDSDFVDRNYWKGALALGDAVLIASQRHQTAYRGRDVVFQQIADQDEAVRALDLEALYSRALEFKFSPHLFVDEAQTTGSLLALAERWAQTLRLVESRRTGQTFDDLAGYMAWRGRREPELSTWRCVPKNVLRNLRLGQLSARYPREALYRRLPGLLCQAEPTGPAWPGSTARFLDIWGRYN
jgi:hypothetical protein